MEITLTSDQQALARLAVQAGRLSSETQAIEEALGLWEERERRRIEFLTTLNDARSSIAKGQGREITEESMHRLVSDVAERGRRKLQGNAGH